MSKFKLTAIILITALITATVSVGGMYVALVGIPGLLSPRLLSGYNKLDYSLEVLREQFYQDFDFADMTDAAIAAAADSLGDPYTAYLTSDEWADFNEGLSGKYTGIGVTAAGTDDSEYIVVVAPFDGSPAEKAGIKPLDEILEVDGVPAYYKDFEAIMASIRGEKGTPVTLRVRHSDGTEQEMTIIRDVIYMQSVSHEMMGAIGYIRISAFDEQTGRDFRSALKDVTQNGAQGLILDLRSNGGGLVDACCEVADALLDGDVIVYTEDRQGRREYANATKGATQLPMTVLIDRGTASASEILAGALRDNDVAVVIGETSFGKGLIQTTIPFSDGSALKYTVQRYFTPGGSDINHVGIVPDVEVIIPDEDYATLTQENDPQLLKAIEIVNGLIQ